MTSALIYDFLLLLMTCSLFLSGWLISRGNVSYWKGAMVGIVAYALNVGLRFGRGIDYNLYVDIFNLIKYGIESDHEILFVSSIKLVCFFGGSWPVFVFLLSLFFIISVYVFLQNFKSYVVYCLPIFPFFSMFAENIMRQTMGLSFLLIGLYFLMRKNRSYIWFFVFSFLGVLCHSVTLVFALIFFLVSFRNKILVSPKYSIPLFLIFLFTFKIENLMAIMSLFTSLMVGEHYAQYADNADFWLQKGFVDSASYTVTALYVFTVYFGYKIHPFFGKKYRYVYNIFLLGFLFYPISVKIELLTRLGVVLEMFIFVILGCLFYYYIIYKRMNAHKIAFSVLCLLYVNLLRVYIMTPFQTPIQYLYLWDANGREKIETTDYK